MERLEIEIQSLSLRAARPTSFALHTGGGELPHGVRAFCPVRAAEYSPGQGSEATAALGKKQIVIGPSPPRSPNISESPVGSGGSGEWGRRKASAGWTKHPLSPESHLWITLTPEGKVGQKTR